MNLVADLNIAGPDALLAAVGLAGVLLCAIIGDRMAGPMRWLSVLALGAAAAVAFYQIEWGRMEAFGGLYEIQPVTSFAKGVMYAMAAACTFMSGGALKRQGMDRYEYSLLTVLASMGAGVMLSANDLMTLYMGVETLSLASYVLAAFQRDSVKSAEAGLKYFVLGALASGLLLYGASLVYGYAGSTRYDVIAAAPTSIGMTFGLVLLITGLAFKCAAAPFHVWTPDVYEGAPAPTVAFFATAPKIAAVVLMANVMFNTFASQEESWRGVIAIIAAASMLIGSFGALMQNNVKRILAYSSISNVGFALIGLAAGTAPDAELGAGSAQAAVLVYMTLYVVATLGVFGGVIALRRGGKAVESISDLNGLFRLKPGVGVGMVLLIFSIAGIPPMAGFFGKLQVFQAGLAADMLWLVLVGALSSVVSLGYYLRMVWAIMVKPAGEPLDDTDWPVSATVLASGILIFPVLTVGIQMLLNQAAVAAAAG